MAQEAAPPPSMADSAPWIAPVTLMLVVQAFLELNLIHPTGPIRRLFFDKLPQIATIIGVSDACFALSAIFWWNGDTSFACWTLVIFCVVKPLTEWFDSILVDKGESEDDVLAK